MLSHLLVLEYGGVSVDQLKYLLPLLYELLLGIAFQLIQKTAQVEPLYCVLFSQGVVEMVYEFYGCLDHIPGHLDSIEQGELVVDERAITSLVVVFILHHLVYYVLV